MGKGQGPRPGRKVGAEKRRLARQEILAMRKSSFWEELPPRFRVALTELVPEVKNYSQDNRN